MAQFTIDISYGQVSIFDARLAQPFNDWSDDHVLQGFAWRPGSVSFGTLTSAGPTSIEVSCSREFDNAKSSASRVIVVPFSVPEHGDVEVGSISSSAVICVAPGEYELTFEHGLNGAGEMWVHLHFRAVAHPVEPRIVRADEAIAQPAQFVMTAEPA